LDEILVKCHELGIAQRPRFVLGVGGDELAGECASIVDWPFG
jgi:hypothetical protein